MTRFFRRYRWWILVIIAGCYLLARTRLLDFPFRGWGDPISENNYYRIRVGMTEQDVTRILRGQGEAAETPEEPWKKFWTSRTGRVVILVDFDEKTGAVKRTRLALDGRVVIVSNHAR